MGETKTGGNWGYMAGPWYVQEIFGTQNSSQWHSRPPQPQGDNPNKKNKRQGTRKWNVRLSYVGSLTDGRTTSQDRHCRTWMKLRSLLLLKRFEYSWAGRPQLKTCFGRSSNRNTSGLSAHEYLAGHDTDYIKDPSDTRYCVLHIQSSVSLSLKLKLFGFDAYSVWYSFNGH